MNLAKPSGITLKRHTDNVIAQAEEWIFFHKQAFDKYKRFFGNSVEESLLKVCKYHDLGKKIPEWQSACQAEFKDLKDFGKFSGRYLRDAKVRHEVHSVLICEENNIDLSEEEKVAIACHHGKLGSKHEEKWTKWQLGKGTDLWKKFKSLDFNSVKEAGNSIEPLVRKSYQFDFLRAALQLADKRASTIENEKPVSNRFSFDYSFNENWSLRPVQKIARENSKKLFSMLRAPTGAGKTDASLLWAKQQIEVEKRADRLIIAMPTRFTSNALGVNISASISQTGIYHSTAMFLKEEGIEGNHYASLFETPVTVCTIDHLLYCLSKTKEDHHISFANLSSSCIVFDEADFYDDFTQENLLVLLQVLNVLEVPVLLMSASLPDSSLFYYRRSGYDIEKILEDDSDLTRPRCKITEIRKYENFEIIEDLLLRAKKEPTIIYVNTVDRALKLGKWFQKNCAEVKVEVYHSRFTEADKIRKEKNLLSMLGKEAWQTGMAQGVAILTQIGEMSVNISANFMISEVCPIDRLVQRVGRLSRFDKTVGELVILLPQKNDSLYPAPYGSFKNRKWTSNKFLQMTIDLIEPKVYSANEFNYLVNDVFKHGVQPSDKSKSNAEDLKKMIRHNWLMLPGFELDEENENGHWRTRDITGQRTVIAMQKNDIQSAYFENWSDLSELIHKRGINCPTYLVKENLKRGRVVKECVLVRGDEKELLFLSPSLEYEDKYGLDLSIPKEEINDQFL
ncbi:CRISPR-associated helicase Cas3' [Echinicola sp. 20G]|uniref:CRISPR-associated helicase Cas3' n=1 Tax=Echinicola sp. 20G TaxID=2781961 RepID=UPI001910C8DB|nr:CRISPR-associated helicase Cas3' [Echinicola sp. 20G]